ITNFDGKFNLEASSKSILVISYIGYLAKELKVSTQTSFAIKLTENSKALEEVVVIGYGTMKKSDINAAIVSIKPEDLQMNSASSLTQTLSGKAAGVTVLGGSAQPGGGAEILIRGAASVGAGNEPLYVLDGFPLSNTGVEPGSGNRYSQGNRNILNSINPNDIASIEILKDASATAIYGSRGCNGVILITTKRGNKGLKVEYSGNYSVQTITKRPEMLTAAEQMTEANSYLYDQSLIRYTAYPYGTRDVSTLPTFVPKYTQTEIDAAGVGTDWYGLITQMGKVNQQNISISKGTEDTKVMFSLNYFDQEGVVKTSGLQRYSGRLNLDQKLTSWLDYGISLTGSVVENQNAALGGGEQENSGIIQSALQYSPRIIAQREENGEYILNPNQALIPNPLSFLDIKDNTTQKRWLTNLFMNVHFSNYLTLRVSAGMDDQRATRKTYLPKTFMYGKGQNGVGSINNSFKTDYLTETTLSYNRKLNNIHNLSGLLGYSYQQFNSDGSSGNNYSFFSDAFLYNNLSAGEGTPTVGSYR
ncbi:MAG: SusC/RagA family TonB-linked outer membrane protein, partial [Paludibacter sp.]